MLISEYVCSNDYTTGVCPAVHRCPPWVPCPCARRGRRPRGTALARGGTISRGTFVSDDTKCLKSWGHCRTGLRDETRLWKMPPLPLLIAVPYIYIPSTINTQPFNLQPLFWKSGSRKVVLQTRIFFSGQPVFLHQKKNPSFRTTCLQREKGGFIV